MPTTLQRPAPRRLTRAAGVLSRTAAIAAAVAVLAGGQVLPAGAQGLSAPVGVLESVTATADTVTVSGWTFDPDTDAPIAAHVYVGSAGVAVTAGVSRPDVARVFGRGDRHGFTTTVPATPGVHTVCVYGINSGPGGHTQLGCRTVTVAARNTAPVGAVDVVTATADGVVASGWAFDPDTSAPIAVHAYVDSTGVAVTADRSRPDVARAFSRGDRHGFSVTMAAGPGRHSVCLYAINATPGTNVELTCRSVVVPDSSASGSATDTPPAAAGGRSPSLHPFASSSVWNTAMGSGAAFEPASGTRTSRFLSTTPFINRTSWSVPVFQARTSDAQVTLQSVRDKRSYTVRMPAGTTTTGGSDGHATVVAPDGVTAYDMFKLVKIDAHRWQAQSVTVTDLRGSGIGAGVRASAVPAMAGLIRAHELREGRIAHALAVAVPNSVLKSGHVWPAARQDADGARAYSGTVPMGTLFAIPPSVDVDRLRLSTEGRALAHALQDYGAYVVDRAGSAALYCELACDAAATNRMNHDWKTLYREMRAVTNSSPSSVGGGGTPRAAAAGALS